MSMDEGGKSKGVLSTDALYLSPGVLGGVVVGSGGCLELKQR